MSIKVIVTFKTCLRSLQQQGTLPFHLEFNFMTIKMTDNSIMFIVFSNSLTNTLFQSPEWL